MQKVGFLLIAMCVATACQTARASAQTLDDTGLWFAAFGNGEVTSVSGESTPLLWYLNQFVNDQGGNDGMNHIFSVNFYF